METDTSNELRIIEKGFNFSQDGHGNRLVYHLQGCNMHCPWCANPESMKINGTLMRDQHAHEKLSCITMTVREMIDESIASRVLFFDEGGVTLSGGEPTMQWDAVKALLENLKGEGINTAIETNGSHPRLPELFPLIDELIVDFKHPDDKQHQEITGLSNHQVLINLEQAFAEHPNVLVRTPLVNAYNAHLETICEFRDFYRRFDTGRARFEFLKYHEYGKSKWDACGMPYRIQNGFVSDTDMEYWETIYATAGLRVVHT